MEESGGAAQTLRGMLFCHNTENSQLTDHLRARGTVGCNVEQCIGNMYSMCVFMSVL